MADRFDPPPSPEDEAHEDPPPRVIHLSLHSSGDAPLDQGFGGGDRSHGFVNFLDSALDSARAPSASPALLQSVARADEGNGPAAQARPAESILQSVARADEGNGPTAQAMPAEGITGDENPASAELPPAAHPTPASVPPESVFHAKGGNIKSTAGHAKEGNGRSTGDNGCSEVAGDLLSGISPLSSVNFFPP